MQSQQSFQRSSEGCLYLVPTPIGNLSDMTFRAVTVLKEADLVACEDTRVTKKLMNHFDIATPLYSYHEHNKGRSGKHLIKQLESGKTVALVTDAGTPALSDPGSDLVAACIAARIAVVPLPGANAATTALIASGLPATPFYFYGFLPRQKKEQKNAFQQLKLLKDSIVFYEAPHRLQETLKRLHENLGNRKAAIARELTKRYEQFVRGTLAELYEWSREHSLRGEFCIIVEGMNDDSLAAMDEWWQSLTVKEHVHHYVNKEDMHAKEAVKRVARERKLPKRAVYHAYHIE